MSFILTPAPSQYAILLPPRTTTPPLSALLHTLLLSPVPIPAVVYAISIVLGLIVVVAFLLFHVVGVTVDSVSQVADLWHLLFVN